MSLGITILRPQFAIAEIGWVCEVRIPRNCGEALQGMYIIHQTPTCTGEARIAHFHEGKLSSS